MKKLINLISIIIVLITLGACSNSTNTPNSKVTLNLESTTNGNVITLSEIPKGTTFLEILSFQNNRPTGLTIQYEVNSTNKATTFIDYFVNKNEEYSYYANFYGPNWSNLGRTNTRSIKATKGGKGELVIINEPKADYNPATDMYKFTKLPQLKGEMENFLTTNATDTHYSVCYRFIDSNTQRSQFYYFEISNQPKKFVPSSDRYTYMHGAEANLNCFRVRATINNTMYDIELPKTQNMLDKFTVWKPSK